MVNSLGKRKNNLNSDSLFICRCGSTVLALSHTWAQRARLEEVGFVGDDGRVRVVLGDKAVQHTAIAKG